MGLWFFYKACYLDYGQPISIYGLSLSKGVSLCHFFLTCVIAKEHDSVRVLRLINVHIMMSRLRNVSCWFLGVYPHCFIKKKLRNVKFQGPVMTLVENITKDTVFCPTNKRSGNHDCNSWYIGRMWASTGNWPLFWWSVTTAPNYNYNYHFLTLTNRK